MEKEELDWVWWRTPHVHGPAMFPCELLLHLCIISSSFFFFLCSFFGGFFWVCFCFCFLKMGLLCFALNESKVWWWVFEEEEEEVGRGK